MLQDTARRAREPIADAAVNDGRAGDDLIVVPGRHIGRWVAAGFLLAIVGLVAWSVSTNPNFNWPIVAHYLFDPLVLQGAWMTLWLTIVVMIVGILLGIVLAVMHISDNVVLSSVSGAYIWFFRGTPVMVQLIFWYNLAALYPRYFLGIPFLGITLADGSVNDLITPYTAAVLCLGLNEAAYMAEIIRAGILSIESGQDDAARALGMRRGLIMRRIIIPQAMRTIIPPTGNQVIGMLKGTSIVSIIALGDLLYSVQMVYSRTYQTIPLLLVACFWYLVITTVLTAIQSRIERRMGRSQHRSSAKRNPLLSLIPFMSARTKGASAVPGLPTP
ncbi:amino acid ABC transporter permease [Kaistia dalseonensis]|uniref:Polar amino acid transport system permease protein n=1 Tax=Kaistia dalseonensis TaxID=410840 RepID=A0ABU0H9H5_9HYPH|nr:amino acid ABC transporter permease [Kaistia dalseonensis]MCX5495557.1 amino acid ABC transporter permease [Kaistia dalseonensis]MDQ0438149.1 polar amino acid transport system permease protein [Kaistia dalseonensis]